jgi:[ribosomal protein S5]-alanine N-acetyltransferase
MPEPRPPVSGAGVPWTSRGPRLGLRPLEPADRDSFLALTRASRGFHRPWIRPPVDAGGFAGYLLRMDHDGTEALAACRLEDGRLVGLVNLNRIVREPPAHADLGYSVGAGFAGRGYMTEAVGLALERAFAQLGLERLDAHVHPANEVSVRLLRRLGFARVSAATRLVLVGDEWRPHERWVLPAVRWRRRAARERPD